MVPPVKVGGDPVPEVGVTIGPDAVRLLQWRPLPPELLPLPLLLPELLPELLLAVPLLLPELPPLEPLLEPLPPELLPVPLLLPEPPSPSPEPDDEDDEEHAAPLATRAANERAQSVGARE